MATHARTTSILLPATALPSALLCPGPRLAPAAGPTPLPNADEAIQAIREGVECYRREAGAIVAQRGVAYRRRGAWAAFLHSGERIGQFASAREAAAALGGAS